MPLLQTIKRFDGWKSPFEPAKTLAILVWEIAAGLVVWVLVALSLMED